ncbi:MAG: PKD domain-containing protein [bacterium]|nr:PKD domain-containing protein [bacterium]
MNDIPKGIDVSGTHVVVVGGTTLTILDIANESAPVVAGSLVLPDNLYRVHISGTLAAISGRYMMYVVDIADPANPALLGDLAMPDNPETIITYGDYAYLTHGGVEKLSVVDFADPSNPFEAATLTLPNFATQGLAILGDHIVLSTHAELLTIDISTPDVPVINANFSLGGLYICDLALSGNTAFLSINHGAYPAEIHAFDISNLASPQSLNAVVTSIPGGYYPRLDVAADVVYFRTLTSNCLEYKWNGGAFIYQGYISPFSGTLTDLVVKGENLYFLERDQDFVHAVSVQSPSPLEPIGDVATPGTAEGVIVPAGRADIAYVADGEAGLQVVDITDPLNPFIVGTVDTPGYAVDIALLGNTVFVADSGEGVQAIDVSTPSSPAIIGNVDTPGSAVDIALTATHAYVADTDQGVQVVDIQVPAALSIIGSQSALTASTGIDVTIAHAYVADGNNGLVIIDTSDPANPWIIDGAQPRNLTSAQKVDYSQNTAYVTDTSNSLHIIDVSDPENPSSLSNLNTQESAGDVDIMGIFAYVGSGTNMQLVDVREGDNPATVGTVGVPATAEGMHVNEFYAYVAAGSAGLQVCPTQCGFDESIFVDFLASPQEDFYPITVDFANLCEGYGLSYSWDFGDGVGTSIEENPTYSYTEPADYPVKLVVTNGANTDSLTVIVSALAEAPTITSISDVPADQGGVVYVRFYHSGYDNGDLNRIEMYTIQRQDVGEWVTVATTGAYGEHYYAVSADTQGDGAGWTAPFRVIAHMEEGNWASAPIDGFSEDNIAPDAPANVSWLAEWHLGWDQVSANDFAYYRIYGSTQPNLDDAVSLATTVDTDIILGEMSYPWVLVVAVDDAELESDPSTPVVVTGVNDLVSEVQLGRAVPNPFNPSTRISFALPTAGPVSLVIYDVGGRLVKTLVNEAVVAGHHHVDWHGKDDSGNTMASGTYLYRLRADGVELTQRMVLLK